MIHQEATQLLGIYLITHNRPDQALEAIESILAQSDSRFELVVSDNSDTDQLRSLLGDREDLIYTKRAQVLSGIDHGNTVISEIVANKKYDFFTIFHDDDLMLPNYVSQFWKAQTLFPEAIAFGTNAVIERHGVRAGSSFKAAKHYVGPVSPDHLLRRYFSHHQLGIAPLPSYIYKCSAVDQLRFDVRGGKYSDVQWLSGWAAKGQMIWISAPMMVYRFHETNDGSVESRHDRLRFLAYLKSSDEMFSPEILSDYRNFLYKKLVLSFKDDRYAWRLRVLSRFIQSHRCERLLRISFYQALLNKLLTRISMRFTKSSKSA